MAPEILWSPREVLTGRSFRLPVRSRGPVTLDPGAFRILQTAPQRNGVTCFYVAAPASMGMRRITAADSEGLATADIGVRTLDELRAVRRVGANVFPRRWPLGGSYARAKRGQTFVTAPDFTPSVLSDNDRNKVRWLLALNEAEAWAQLPPSELPRVGVVNKREGCPIHGTAIFAHGGFYPWVTKHEPARALCHCPVGKETYPSNGILAGDFTSGACPDDGFGYVDSNGSRFRFVSYYNWFQISHFSGSISLLSNLLIGMEGADSERAGVARRLGLLLVRQAVEELYLAAVPQFRFGSHHVALENGLWGPPDTAAMSPFPDDRPYANGTVHYTVSMPGIAAMLAVAYDAAYPWLSEDHTLVLQLRACGVPVASPADVLQLVEEMLAAFLQHHLDGYSSCNHPFTSVGTLVCLRVLDRPDMRDLLDFLYDTCDDQIRTFIANGFYPDGVGYEASGGYNMMHVSGAYQLDRHIEGLRRLRPEVVRPDRYPAIDTDPKFPLIALPGVSTTLCDRTAAAYGDDRAPGAMAEGCARVPTLPNPCLVWTGWEAPMFFRDVFRRSPTLTHARILRRLGLADREPGAGRLLKECDSAWSQAGVLLDHGGIGILRLPGAGRERAAAFIHFISQPFHRHDDFCDLQFVAFDRTWYFDFGYPALHETDFYWEGHWVTHNRGKVLDGLEDEDGVGTGSCSLFVEGAVATAIEVEGIEGTYHDWRIWTPQSRYHRRLVVLLPTVGDGVAVVDCYRLHGGSEHWRTYPGIQGRMVWTGASPLRERPGTAAGADINRGQIEKARSGCAGLAMIDSIREGPADAPWKATWFSRDDERWRLDVHGVRCPPGTQAMSGRAGHPLTKPEESPYSYTPLLLRAPASPPNVSAFDLVFEPYADTPTIRSVEQLRPTGGTPDSATGIRITLADGAARVILWNPDRSIPAAWEGGWGLTGPLAIWQLDASGTATICMLVADSASAFGATQQSAPPAVRGRIQACASECEIIVEPESVAKFRTGDRVRILPRGHWYRIVRVEPADGNRVCLTLDRPRVLSKVRVSGVAEQELVLNARLPLAWAGYFRHCTLVDPTGASVPIEDIRMREDRPLAYAIIGTADPAARTAFQAGSWADLVDYVPGDRLVGSGCLETSIHPGGRS